MNPKQIVLLGGGYTSIWAYRSLVQNLRKEIARGEVNIRVVCPEDHHFFHGWTAESLTGIVQNKNRMSPLSSILTKAELIRGYADEINSVDNLVYVNTATGCQILHYDHLVIGIGAFDSDQVAGLRQYGYQIKSFKAFQDTQNGIHAAVHHAATLSTSRAEGALQFTVCGGGYTGIELATNIAEFLQVLLSHYPSLRGVRPTIRLVHSKAEILDALNPALKKMRRYAEKIMKRYGIEMINGRRVKEITRGGAILDDQTFLPSAMVISTIGQSRLRLKGTEQMKRDNLNRLCVNRFLQAEDHHNLWGGGDACAVPYRNTQSPCVPNALWAMKHGEYIGRNIARILRHRPLLPFMYRGLGQCASLGIGKGIGELYGWVFTGRIAWIMRWFFFNYFMPSRKVMVNEIADWLHLLFVGRRKGLTMREQLLPRDQSTRMVINPHQAVVRGDC